MWVMRSQTPLPLLPTKGHRMGTYFAWFTAQKENGKLAAIFSNSTCEMKPFWS